MCFETLDSREIHEISVDAPTPPLDELYFRKAVAWCYVLFHETGPFIKFSGMLLRTRTSQAHEQFGQTKRLVDCARTVHVHNLLRERRIDNDKERFYGIWLLGKGGDPLSWELCNRALVNAVDEVLSAIEQEWRRISEDESDRQELWRKYELEKRTFWEAHEFDPFVAKAVEEAGLDGLDSTLFRKDGDRVERWRKLVSCFDTRESAEGAINRAIRAEVFNVFGHSH